MAMNKQYRDFLEAQNKSQREFFESRFEGMRNLVDAHFENTHETLDEIKAQNKIRNGRLEKDEDKIVELEKRDLTHILTCPNVPRITALEKMYSYVQFIAEHPKTMFGAIVMSIVLIIASSNKLSSITRQRDMRELTKELIESIDSLRNQTNATVQPNVKR